MNFPTSASATAGASNVVGRRLGDDPRRNLLAAYLLDLQSNHYMAETVMERKRTLDDWRALAPAGGDAGLLFAFLDRWASADERLRRFVAIRSFTRWAARNGHIADDWTTRVDMGRVFNREL